MIAGVAALSFMDGLGKSVAAGHSVFQMLAIRSTVALALVVPALALTGRLGMLATRQPLGHAARAACGVIAFATFYTSLRYLSLADAVAIAFGSPFIVTALAGVFLHEPVGWRRWVAITLGFLGMLVIVRPTSASFQPAALLVLVTSVAYATLMFMTRWMSRPAQPPESTGSFVFYMLLGQGAAGWLVMLGTPWETPSPRALLQISGMGVLAIAGNYGIAEAFRRTRAAVVAPLEYTGLIWAVALGWLVFGDFPGTTFWFGAAVIVAAGVYAVRAE
jgi:drug/metabolite transporter (DMT)-like permease